MHRAVKEKKKPFYTVGFSLYCVWMRGHGEDEANPAGYNILARVVWAELWAGESRNPDDSCAEPHEPPCVDTSQPPTRASHDLKIPRAVSDMILSFLKKMIFIVCSLVFCLPWTSV